MFGTDFEAWLSIPKSPSAIFKNPTKGAPTLFERPYFREKLTANAGKILFDAWKSTFYFYLNFSLHLPRQIAPN